MLFRSNLSGTDSWVKPLSSALGKLWLLLGEVISDHFILFENCTFNYKMPLLLGLTFFGPDSILSDTKIVTAAFIFACIFLIYILNG